ncbi:alpha/beta fold hydrolase (plasmid) [Coraliomargarita sp. W4R53]
MNEVDVTLLDGRILHAYDVAVPAPTLTLMWHHGSPQTGAPLAPVIRAAAERSIRVISFARPSYGGSSPLPGRSVASVATDAAAVADALGVDTFATMGASGGGPHALACAALLGERVTGVVTFAGIAPRFEAGDWMAGMASPQGLQSATLGREARAKFEETAEFDPAQFIAADYAALESTWSSLGEDVGKSHAFGMDGLVDDDVAFAKPWGFDPAVITAPVLVVQGELDRVIPPSHGLWLANRVPNAELWSRPGGGHISVLDEIESTLDWLASPSISLD